MDDLPPNDSSPLLRTAVIAEGGLTLIALALGWLVGSPPLDQIGWTWLGIGQGLVATVPLLVGLVLLDRLPFGPLRQLDDLMRQSILPLFRNSSVAELLLISLLAGIGEELLFRGATQDALQRLTGEPWLGVCISAILFGLAHPISRTYVALATAIGIYFGVLMAYTGNLLVPIICHAAYDFGAILYLLCCLNEKPKVEISGSEPNARDRAGG